ncbi:MAG TPA: hypothetical protein VK483_16070 [Chitinophagaceae bacterium]|nr:hypothetical protein [Chitinophagaceae bacterium]
MKNAEKKLKTPGNDKELTKPIRKRSSYTGKTPKQIISKHILDKNDVITEEDFKNLNISIDVSNDTAQQPLEIPGNKERPKDEDKDPVVVTPWDVIS